MGGIVFWAIIIIALVGTIYVYSKKIKGSNEYSAANEKSMDDLMVRRIFAERKGLTINSNRYSTVSEESTIDLDRHSAANKESTFDLLLRLLKELNCEPKVEEERNGEEIFVTFGFQGGNFRITMSSKSAYSRLSFLFFFETTLENLDLIRYVCNQLNFNADISKLIYTIDEEKNRVHIHIFKEMLLIKEIPDVKVYFESALTDCFELKRAFIYRFDELVPNKQGKDLERERAEWIRELFLLREQEFSHQNNEWQWRLNETKRLTLGQVIKTFLDLQEDSLIELKVITEDMKIITNPDAIKEFDLLSPIIAFTNPQEASFICQNATLILTCIESHEEKDVSRIVTLSVKSEGETENSLYARITYTQVPQNINRTIPYGNEKNRVNAHSFLVAWDKFSDNQKIAEFNYLWQEAKEKQETGKFAELTEEQKLICYCVYPHTAYRIYWGKKLFLDKRYYEALLHLENAYFTLQANYHSLHESYKENFYEVCYLIGFCYCELLQFQRAFYFLDIVFNLNRIMYIQEYVNCLANSKDFRAIMIIDRLLEQTNNRNKEESEEEINPALVSFVHFLRRRKAYVYIDLGRLDEAENVFKSMLEEPENSDYALNELAYIQTLRKDKA